ncbi:transporter [Maridesulfovibrio zosterae]|uniref:transporter n=1 Tax=Maridesulfovibrio zosterae TaxID=82171 RepID=UPI0003FD7B07|nr:transporter [Maridesulfovibrio zosterae]
MKWMKVQLLIALMILCCGVTVYAEENYPVAWGPASTTFGPCGLSMPTGKLAVGGNIFFGDSNGLWKHSKRINGNTKATKLNEVFKLRYGIWDGLDARIAIPVYNVHMEKTNTSNHDLYGVGDMSLLLHQRLLNQKAGDPFSLAIDFGPILPTGTVSEHSSNVAGNSAWGVMGGIGATYFLYANRFDTEVNYATFSEGGHDYQKGDRFRWNLAYAYALNENWDIGLESSMEIYAESEQNGLMLKDSSLEWYAGPKVAYKYKPWGTFAGLTFKAPVERWYQGTKACSDDYRVEFKLIKTFDLAALFK